MKRRELVDEMPGFRFLEPGEQPPAALTRYDYAGILERLKSRPGAWAIVLRANHGSAAYVAHRLRDMRCEARRHGGPRTQNIVFARWVGP